MLISIPVFWAWSWRDAKRRSVTGWWVVPPASFCVGLSLSLAAELGIEIPPDGDGVLFGMGEEDADEQIRGFQTNRDLLVVEAPSPGFGLLHIPDLERQEANGGRRLPQISLESSRVAIAELPEDQAIRFDGAHGCLLSHGAVLVSKAGV